MIKLKMLRSTFVGGKAVQPGDQVELDDDDLDAARLVNGKKAEIVSGTSEKKLRKKMSAKTTAALTGTEVRNPK